MIKRICYIPLMLLLLVSCQEKKFDRFERESIEYTMRHCPKQMDEITVLDSMVFHNDGSLDYKYYYSVQLTKDQYEAFQNILGEVKDIALKSIRNSIDLKPMKEAGLNFVYIYRDAKTGKHLAKYVITPEEYQ
ncbi:MAG: hypothetical protein IJ901_01035 [Bacteroidaceae bacterium]|nr:hypothetical protein [Bacteroidaceae bacterium]